MSRREFSLPDWFESSVSKAIAERGLSLQDSRKIADAVLRMSDFYIQQPEASTPWKETWCQVAQLAYFLPLNFIRSQAVFKEAQDRNFPWKNGELLDFGSGLGAGSLPWLQEFSGSTVYVERSSEAQKLHKMFLQNLPKPQKASEWISERDIRPSRNRTALFSYSLTELTELPSWIFDCESLIWIEPSTRTDGRLLLQRRKELLEKDFSMWAPCPHQQGCSLFENSKTDWCHDRIFFEMPKWFSDIERFLPMKNASLTFSYLLTSRKPAPSIQQWRTVGDQLDEKGKTRQLICRGPEREFLSWLHRDGKVPEVARGILINPPEKFEIKGTELRIQK
ncbi:MAG: small ribosomal subunit Rsm22 family protein [Pseudobdellovibrionaceae bacterium]